MPFSKTSLLPIHTMPKRHDLLQHLTVSAVTIAKGHTLLIDHKRIGAWLPPGGHVETNEMPHEGAIREVFEETGVIVEIISEKLPDTGDSSAYLLPNPLCTHAVRATEKGVDLYHFDIVYLCRPVMQDVELDPELALPIIIRNDEVHSARWVKLEDMAELKLAKNVVEVFSLAAKRLEGFGH